MKLIPDPSVEVLKSISSIKRSDNYDVKVFLAWLREIKSTHDSMYPMISDDKTLNWIQGRMQIINMIIDSFDNIDVLISSEKLKTSYSKSRNTEDK